MFFDRYADLCKAKGVSCKKAAIDMGLNSSIPATWKRRGSTPNGETLSKIAAYFGITVDELLGTESEKSPAVSVDPATAELMYMVEKMTDEQRARALAVLKAAFGER